MPRLAPLPLALGDTGDAVRDLQQRLARTGHVCGDDPLGRFGPATQEAVRAFQQRRGLRADGVCGDQTWASLVEAGHILGARLLYLRSPMLRGDDVAELQRLLGELGFDAGRVDGILGPATAAAVSEFQRNAGLTTDGICGPDTVDALRRVAGRTERDGPVSTVASLREVEGLRHARRSVEGLRVAVAEDGGLGAFADGLARDLADRGAVVTVLRHPSDSDRAAAANAFEAGAFVALRAVSGAEITCAFYANDGFESYGGRRLAELIAAVAAGAVGYDPIPPRGMRLPALRETRMPAVVVELGPPAVVVQRTADLVHALADAVSSWAAAPVDA